MIKSSKSLYSSHEYSVKSTPGYVINRYGDVYGRRRRLLTVCMSGSGYLFVRTTHGTRYIHRLIAEAFIPLEDDASDYVVRHKDGNRLNNTVENLEWKRR